MQVHKALITPFIHPFNKSLEKSLCARRWVICQLHIGEDSRPSEPALPMFTLSKPRGRGPQTGPSNPLPPGTQPVGGTRQEPLLQVGVSRPLDHSSVWLQGGQSSSHFNLSALIPPSVKWSSHPFFNSQGGWKVQKDNVPGILPPQSTDPGLAGHVGPIPGSGCVLLGPGLASCCQGGLWAQCGRISWFRRRCKYLDFLVKFPEF